jgi:hypothetical protein
VVPVLDQALLKGLEKLPPWPSLLFQSLVLVQVVCFVSGLVLIAMR